LDLEKADNWIKAKPNRHQFSTILNNIKNGNMIYPCIIIKNPYSWYQSIKKWSGAKFKLEKTYKRYNELYTSYKHLYEEGYKVNKLYNKGIVVRYEDVLEDPQKVISEIADSFGLESKGGFTIPNKVPQSDKFGEDRKKFYLSGGIFDLSKELADKITELVDWELMKFYGYKPR
jgi:hypothetical protein